MTAESPAIIVVIDDDDGVRTAVSRLIRSVGLEVEAFPSARDFLDREASNRPSCIVLDVRMPGLSGLDLQDELAVAGGAAPIIFITGHGTVPLSVRALKGGAVDFLEKPFEDQDLLDAIHGAIERDVRERQKDCEAREIRQRVELLTPRPVVTAVAGELGHNVTDVTGS